MNLREFFIEDRLEKFRISAPCNLGESGIRNISLGQLSDDLELDLRELGDLSLADSPNSGRMDLRQEIANLYKGVSPDQVLVTTGTGEALYIAFQLLIQKNDLVSLFYPSFQALYEVPRYFGAKLQKVDLLPRLESGEKGFGEENITKLFSNSPRLVVCNHPQNPTGIVASDSDKNLIIELGEKHPGWILFDEHYRFLSEEDDLGWSGCGVSPTTITTGSITKCFGVMGLRIGWLVGPETFIREARAVKDYLTHTVSPISEFLTLRLLQKRKILQSQIRKNLRSNIDLFNSVWKNLPGIESFFPPRGGVVGFPKLSPGIESKSYCDLLYENAGVFVLPSLDFEVEGYLRVGFGETPERFEAGLERWSKLGSDMIARLNK